MSDDISDRLARLERSNRHLRLWAIFLTGVALLAIGMGAKAARPGEPTKMDGPLVFVDKEGRERIWLGVEEGNVDGSPALIMRDSRFVDVVRLSESLKVGELRLGINVEPNKDSKSSIALIGGPNFAAMAAGYRGTGLHMSSSDKKATMRFTNEAGDVLFEFPPPK